ncbi:serine/threonine protein kinase, partial [Myxococcota bacterium]|nr:serine/threonine protein kinase [Myxococcota bacterium]
MPAERPAGGPKDDPSGKQRLAAAPKAAIGRDVLLPRRSLSIGAIGRGDANRRYRLVASIDKGGMGELFLAEAHAPGQAPRYVVIKRLLADLIDDDKYVAMFANEAEVMSKLDHPNIVRVFDLPVIDGTQCLAMEYVRGRNVQQILARTEDLGQHIPPPVVLRAMSLVLRGLDHAHNYKLPDGRPLDLVHRDVTPGNVLVSFDGDVKLTDFGIAKHQMSAVSTTVGIVKGKARYLAPEQILGEQATPRSDVFSAAGVTLEMLTGVPVFDKGSVPKTLYAIVHGERMDVEQALGFRAPLLVQLLNRALATDPKQRIQTARELADGFEAAARLLGKPVDRDGTGRWLRELYADVDDPLAKFDPRHLEALEHPTVNFRAPPASGSGRVRPDSVSGSALRPDDDDHGSEGLTPLPSLEQRSALDARSATEARGARPRAAAAIPDAP